MVIVIFTIKKYTSESTLRTVSYTHLIEVNDAPFEYQFMEYTNTGRRLRGLKPNILSEYLESWKEFSEITDGDYLGKGNLLSDKEILNAFEDGELGTMYEDVYMSSCIVVVDAVSYTHLNVHNQDLISFYQPFLYYTIISHISERN